MTIENFKHRNLYSVLGAQPSAHFIDMRSKYRQAALRLHPDKGGSSEAFHLLTFAFEVLSCPVARAVYDKNLLQHHISSQHSRLIPHQSTSPTKTVCVTRPVPTGRSKLRAKRAAGAMRTPCPRPATVGSKRAATFLGEVEPPLKRQCTMKATEHCRRDGIGIPLAQLRDVLKSMKADQRRGALQKLAPRLQTALALFMETLANSSAGTLALPNRPSASSTTPKSSAVSGITSSSNAALSHGGSMYKAHVHMKALRFYTRGHADLEVALERQMVLVELRQALSAASIDAPFLWEDAARTYEICSAVLRANATSEHDIGLSAYIYLRAGHHLVQSCTIISPVMPLKEVLELHSRLLRARRTSWQELRAEWVALMRSTRQPMAKRRSLYEAEAVADAARARALQIQLGRAASNATKALELDELCASRRRKVLSQQHVRDARVGVRARSKSQAAERRAAKMREEVRKERRRWWRRSDLTMDEISRGPPPEHMMAENRWQDEG